MPLVLDGLLWHILGELVRATADGQGAAEGIRANILGLDASEGVLWKDKDVSLVDIKIEDWETVVNICMMGVVFICRHGIPELKKAGGGSIINIGSISALTGSTRPQDAYNASKGALIILTKSLAVQFAKDNIRVNIIHPGMINTPMQHKYMENREWLQAVLDSIPAGRFGEPEDIANAALFLASDESAYMTGAELIVDGGFCAT